MLVPLSDPDLAFGDEAELADNRAIGLIQAGFAVPAIPKIERATKRAPEKRRRK